MELLVVELVVVLLVVVVLVVSTALHHSGVSMGSLVSKTMRARLQIGVPAIRGWTVKRTWPSPAGGSTLGGRKPASGSVVSSSVSGSTEVNRQVTSPLLLSSAASSATRRGWAGRRSTVVLNWPRPGGRADGPGAEPDRAEAERVEVDDGAVQLIPDHHLLRRQEGGRHVLEEDRVAQGSPSTSACDPSSQRAELLVRVAARGRLGRRPAAAALAARARLTPVVRASPALRVVHEPALAHSCRRTARAPPPAARARRAKRVMRSSRLPAPAAAPRRNAPDRRRAGEGCRPPAACSRWSPPCRGRAPRRLRAAR